MKTHSAKQEFDLLFATLLHPSSVLNSNVLSFISYALRRYDLNSIYSSYDILSEAYIRGAKAIEAGQEIRSLVPWVKSTCHRIILELSRSRSKYQLIDDSQLSEIAINLEYEADFLDGFDENTRYVLRDSFMQLEHQDQIIIQLRIILGWSWQEVCKYLQARGESTNVSAVRKRGQRALERLRKLYDSKRNE